MKQPRIISTAVATILTVFLLFGEGLSMGVGRYFPLSSPPTTNEWFFIIETLIYSDDPESVAGADATICLRADSGVAYALENLYKNPRLAESKDKIARPFSGFQNKDAAEVALLVIRKTEYNPNDPIVIQSARTVLAHFPDEGARAVLEKLNWWGELPNEEQMEIWEGLPLLNVLLESSSPDSKNVFLKVLGDESEDNSSAARLGAACGLYAIGGKNDATALKNILSTETCPMTRQCIGKLLSEEPQLPIDGATPSNHDQPSEP